MQTLQYIRKLGNCGGYKLRNKISFYGRTWEAPDTNVVQILQTVLQLTSSQLPIIQEAKACRLVKILPGILAACHPMDCHVVLMPALRRTVGKIQFGSPTNFFWISHEVSINCFCYLCNYFEVLHTYGHRITWNIQVHPEQNICDTLWWNRLHHMPVTCVNLKDPAKVKNSRRWKMPTHDHILSLKLFDLCPIYLFVHIYNMLTSYSVLSCLLRGQSEFLKGGGVMMKIGCKQSKEKKSCHCCHAG